MNIVKTSLATVCATLCLLILPSCNTSKELVKTNTSTTEPKMATIENPDKAKEKEKTEEKVVVATKVVDDTDEKIKDVVDINVTSEKATSKKASPKTTPPTISNSMNTLENEMLKEVNMFRKEPYAYVSALMPAYLEYFKKEGIEGYAFEERDAKELLEELKKVSGPLKAVSFSESLYGVAKKQGDIVKMRGNLDANIAFVHLGEKNADLTKRTKDLLDIKSAGENLGFGFEDPSYALINLLIDSGQMDRGHRKVLLNKDWDKAAFYNIGTIGDYSGCWVQSFGVGKKASPKLTLEEVNALVEMDLSMSAEEKAMFNEINLMRSDPVSYIKEVEAYLKDVKAGKLQFAYYADDLAASVSLFESMRKSGPLSVMKPYGKIYDVAKTHGAYLLNNQVLKNGKNPHVDAAGKWDYQRIKDGAGMETGGENIVGDFAPSKPEDLEKKSPRYIFIEFLLDTGVPGYGHRKALLKKGWTHGACLNYGNQFPNDWIQIFGRE